MPWPVLQSNDDLKVIRQIACWLWGAAFVIAGLALYRSQQLNDLSDSANLFGPLVVFQVSSLATLASWLFRKYQPDLSPELELGRCLLAFGPGLFLTATCISSNSNTALSFVFITFIVSAAVLYFSPGQSEQAPLTSESGQPEVSLLDFASQLQAREPQQKNNTAPATEEANTPAAEQNSTEIQDSLLSPEIELQQDYTDQEEPSCDLFNEHSEWVTQKFRRTKTPDGAEAFEGFVKIEWAAGQKSTVINIPFAPPFSKCPEVYCEPDDGCPSRTKVADCRPFGTRIEVRLPQECKEHNYSCVHILACLHADEAEQEKSLTV